MATIHAGELCDDPTTVEGPGEELVQHIYHELRGLAEAAMRRLPPDGPTLQPTALVHEAYLRLTRRRDRMWKGRRHFYRAAGLAMHHILIDRARQRKAKKHGGGWQRTEITVTLTDHSDTVMLSPEDVLTLDAALDKLRREHPDLVEVVLMRYFCGLTVPDIARALGVTTRTVERKWSFARAWLLTELNQPM